MKNILIVLFLTVGLLTAFQVAAIHGHPDAVEEDITLRPGLSIVWDQTFGNQLTWRMENGAIFKLKDNAPLKKMADSHMQIHKHWHGCKGDQIGAVSDCLALDQLLSQGRPQLEWGRPETTNEDIFIMPNPFQPAPPKGVIGTISFDIRAIRQDLPSPLVSMYAAAIKALYEMQEPDAIPSRNHRASAEREQFDVEFFRSASTYLKIRGNAVSGQQVSSWKRSYQLAHLTPQHEFTKKHRNRLTRRTTA